jgi:hypothetical protein
LRVSFGASTRFGIGAGFLARLIGRLAREADPVLRLMR